MSSSVREQPRQRIRRHDARTLLLYAKAIVRPFKWTLLLAAIAVLLGGILHSLLSHPPPPSLVMSFYDAWMALLGENTLTPGDSWFLAFLFGTYPLLGFVLIGEGIVRLALLISSKERSESEWQKVQASTYRDHVVLCGIGHLGFRVLQELVAQKVSVVAIEKNPEARFIAQARSMGVPILVRDMKDDQALIEAGVPHAKSIVIASNDDIANLEVALDARRLNPKIRTLMRLFDQQIAAKISGPLQVDVAFSSSALAAPIVSAMTMGNRVLASFSIEGVQHLTSEIKLRSDHNLLGTLPSNVEVSKGIRVLHRSGRKDGPFEVGETVVLSGPFDEIGRLS